ncbi:hypothetical protein [Clostridium transplantifaecale]|uniref:hypothetical protein n=1 Tax=Clostridium transplantifaecale TaxID=2479838 RepID=UPI000F63900E|nr:hypothetical protein [Clostridium transplantifaecale]
MRRQKNVKKNMGMICAGVLVLSMTGCGTASAQVTETKTMTTVTQTTVTSEQTSGETAGSSAETNQAASDEAFTALAKEALNQYFGVNMTDTAGYTVNVQHMEALPEFDVEQQIAVTFLPDELNLGDVSEDAVIDMENIDTKPMYDVTFTEQGTVKGIHLSYTDWENRSKPVSAETAKELAKEFVISHGLAEESSLNILGSATTSSDTISVVIRHKEGRALLIGVDSLAGRVRFFEDTLEKSAVKSITPLEEGKGVG